MQGRWKLQYEMLWNGECFYLTEDPGIEADAINADMFKFRYRLDDKDCVEFLLGEDLNEGIDRIFKARNST